MADEKPKAPERDTFRETVEIILVILVLSVVVTGITNIVRSNPIFHHGLSGLTPHGVILATTRPIDSLFHPLNSPVIATHDSVAVYDSAGGKRVGSQGFDSHGTIIGGPGNVGGLTYYDVDFDKGTDGWVEQNDVAYIDSDPGRLAFAILYIWKIITYIKYLLMLIAAGLLAAIIVLIPKLTKVRKENHARLYPEKLIEEEKQINPRWQKIQNLVVSHNENDWRLAIIEADIILGDLLETMSLLGESIGEKLKTLDPSDMVNLNAAWEAHKVRNEIAHAGSDFHITDREAKRVIGLYEQVFKEFNVI